MPDQAFSPTLTKSGRVNKDLGVYTAATGWDEVATGQTNAFHEWRGFLSFDTSSMDDTAVVTSVSLTVRRRGDPLGAPETYVLRFSIGTFIGAALDGNSQEWGAGNEAASVSAKPVDKDVVTFSSATHGSVNPEGDTDVKLWDDSTVGSGDESYATNFNKNVASLCKLNIIWVIPELGVATVTGKGTASAAGMVSGGIEADATATGVGTAAGAAVLELPSTATATGVGAAAGAAVLELPSAATATGIGTAAGDATIWLTVTAAATGVGTATGAGTVEGVLFGVATATGAGAATGAAVLEIPGTATATGAGAATADATIWLAGVAIATGIATATGDGTIYLGGTATATGMGSVLATGTVYGNIAHWGEPCEIYAGGPSRGAWD